MGDDREERGIRIEAGVLLALMIFAIGANVLAELM